MMTDQQSHPRQILILGGTGRIGRAVAQDLVQHGLRLGHRPEDAEMVLTGCRPRDRRYLKTEAGWDWLTPQVQFLQLDLNDREALRRAIATAQLVIHCAGPFMQRDGRVLERCIEAGVNYLDVSDCVPFTRRALALYEAAQQAGITAVINSGVFPGISSSMARQAVETLGEADSIQLSYVVAGSGGAGVTIMRTTFLGLLEPVHAWINGQWQTLKPYSDRQSIRFPAPYGSVGTYWYEVPETFTLPHSFPVESVITKFGSAPDFYNHMTWAVAHLFPKGWLRQPQNLESLSQVSYRMTEFTDRWSGTGISIRVDAQRSPSKQITLTLTQPDTAIAAGYGTGSIAQWLLAGRLHRPGVWPVERILPTDLFLQSMGERGVIIQNG